MRLLASTDLGVKILVYMAASSEPQVTVAEMSKTYEVKVTSLKRPLKTLIDHNIVASTTGRAGGYMLRGDPTKLTLGEVIELLEIDLALVPWMEPDEHGVIPHPNSMYRFAVEHARTAFFTHLDNYTIADLAADPYTRAAFKIQHLGKKKRGN